ncbi:MAG: ABC transporter permease subunit [Candidatus Hodarchaeaceae archaeon]|nr:ABC transporter permease subunit [Candidatus Hodarchaeaceae archaeon]
MRPDRVWEIARKDMASVRRHKYVLYGLIGIPLIFAIFIPMASIYPVVTSEEPLDNKLPPFAQPGMAPKQAVVTGLANMAVLMFMFLPAAIPSTIASYTFVGEKVNRQLEPLLATPTTDLELLIGKGLGAFVPAMAATFASFAGLVAIVDVLTFPLFGYLLLPNLISAVVLLVYAPLVCLLSVSWSIFISSKVSDVRAAMQLGIVGIAPVLLFYFLFMGGIVSLEWMTLVAFGLVLASASAGLFALSKATFQREEILTKWR